MQYKKEFALSVSCFLLALLCSMIWLSGSKENLAQRISPHILRFHVIANSNSPRDQEVKLQVKELLLAELNRIPDSGLQSDLSQSRLSQSDLPDSRLLQSGLPQSGLSQNDTLCFSPEDQGSAASSAKEAICQYIQKNQTQLEQKANALLSSLGFSYETQLRITRCYFPTKAYGDIILPRGTYDAVQVSIGDARGRNWWCVVYPRLCFLDATHAIVPESSRQQLKTIVGEEDYGLLLDTRPLDIQVRFRLLETLQDAFFDK